MPVTYTKTVWKGHVVQYPRRYHETDQDGETLHTPAFGTVVEQGTPFTPETMNNIENGVADCAALVNELEQTKIGEALFAATIPTTGWSGSQAPFTRTLTVNGILATDTPIIDVSLTGNYVTDMNICEAWSCVQRIVAAANQLQITADSVPTTAIPIKVRCLR